MGSASVQCCFLIKPIVSLCGVHHCVCPKERLDKTRDALSESKKLNHKLAEQNQNLQRAQEDLELKDSELEKHNRALKEVSH